MNWKVKKVALSTPEFRQISVSDVRQIPNNDSHDAFFYLNIAEILYKFTKIINIGTTKKNIIIKFKILMCDSDLIVILHDSKVVKMFYKAMLIHIYLNDSISELTSISYCSRKCTGMYKNTKKRFMYFCLLRRNSILIQ